MRASDYPLSPKAQAMLMYLNIRANKERRRTDSGEWEFPPWIEVKTSDIMAAMHLSTRPALYSVREELEAGGWIIHMAGIGTHTSAYMVLPTRPFERIKIGKDPQERERLKRLLIWKKTIEERA